MDLFLAKIYTGETFVYSAPCEDDADLSQND